MKINTGNFGYNATTLKPVHTENPEALSGARAEQEAAQSTMQAQNIVQQGLRAQEQAAANKAQAGAQMGQSIAGIGSQLVEHAQKLATQKAELQLQDYQTYKQGVIDGVRQKVADGQLDSTGIQKAYQEGMKGWQGEEIQDLTSSGNLRLTKGMSILDRAGDKQVTDLYGRQLQAERLNAAEQVVAGYTQQLMQPGADVAKVAGQVDEYFNRAETKGLYGAQWTTKYAGAKKNLTTTYYRSQIEAHQDNNGKLNEIRQGIEDNAAQGIIDLDARTALFNTIDTKVTRNEARAQAAQNHADAVATRREVSAAHADDTMTQRIARGEIPTDNEWHAFEQKTDGTSVAGQAPSLRATMKDVQQIVRMPTGAAQQQLDAIKVQLDQGGGTAQQYKYYQTLQRTVDQRRSDMKTNPQAVAAMDAGEPLQAINFSAVQDNPGAIGEVLQQRLTNSKALAQKEGPTAGKDLLTPQEKADIKTMYPKMSNDQRVQFWRNMNASAGKEATTRLANEIGDDTNGIAVVAAQANTKDGYQVAAAVDKGNMLLNPVDGSAKVKAPKDDDIARKLKSEYPSLTQQQIQRLVPTVAAWHIGSGKTAENGIDTDGLHKLIGEPVKVFGGKLIAPPGMSSEVFTRQMTAGVNQLPATDAANVRNHVNDGSYTFIPDATGNMRLINQNTNRAVLVNGKPFVVELPQ